jgi:hypothetical protein
VYLVIAKENAFKVEILAKLLEALRVKDIEEPKTKLSFWEPKQNYISSPCPLA